MDLCTVTHNSVPQHCDCPRHCNCCRLLASESEANGEAFPIHKLPTPPPVKKEVARDAALMRHTFAAPSYGTDTQPYHRSSEQLRSGYQPIASIRDSGDRRVQGDDEELGSKVPRLRQQGHYLPGGTLPRVLFSTSRIS